MDWTNATQRDLTEIAKKYGIAGADNGRTFASVRDELMKLDPTAAWLREHLSPSIDLDTVKIGTVLVHPDGPAFVIGETRTSWKATRSGHELTIAKDTMIARGNHCAGYAKQKYITAARDDDNRECAQLRRSIESSLRSATSAMLRNVLALLNS